MRKTLQTTVIIVCMWVIMILDFTLVKNFYLIKIYRDAYISQKKTISLILKSEKSSDDLSYIRRSISISQDRCFRLSKFIRNVFVFFPIKKVSEIADVISSATFDLPRLFGDGKESDIVLFFLNNYELRPGGGFVGSLGFITFKDYSLTKFEVRDVYEIDGQIVTHRDPHPAVRKYLNQPNEFLRDSNFSPDFGTSTQNSLQTLKSVPSFDKPFSLVIGITTSAFEKLLKLTGPIELADQKVRITSSNFFTVTQNKIESNFFPGSTQKRTLLQSLGNTIRIKILELPPFTLIKYVLDSTQTKNLVFYSPLRGLQNLFINFDLAGSQESVNKNWIMPVDANVGVNKMDALIRKTVDLRILPTGITTTHTFNSSYSNPITPAAEVQEIYKNYFQLYVPVNAKLKKALINKADITDQVVESIEMKNKVYGIYFEVPPSTTASISMTYELPKNLGRDNIEFQKQIGSKPFPLTIINQGKRIKIYQSLLEKNLVFSLL